MHIPFCAHKCGYCDFNAYAGMDGLMPAYMEALIGELDDARAAHEFGVLETVYLGGGTPSLLPAELAGHLLARTHSLINVADSAEVTLEANPASTDPERLAAWRGGA
jgi:oxygen-independent coproporphyrinogen-3 oxidase